MTNGSAAYDLSLFESKKSRVLSLEQNKRAETERKKRNRFQTVLNIAVTAAVAIVTVAVIGALIFYRVRLTEMNNQISRQQEELSELLAENKRLEGELASDTSAKQVESFAEENGLSAINADQIMYVPFDSSSQLEIAAQNDDFIREFFASVGIFFKELVYPST